MWAISDMRMSLFLLSRSLSSYRATVTEEAGAEALSGGGGGGAIGELMMGQQLLQIAGL